MRKLSATHWVTIQTVFTQLFGTVVFAVQAPLLGPRAFGLITIVMVFIGFCEVVLAEAATEILVSIPRIDDLHYATVNALSGAVSLVAAVVLFSCAGSLAALYGTPELEGVLHWMAILPLVSALASAPNAASKREMQFEPLAVRMIAGVMCGGMAGITLAVAGAGVWALVWQAILQRAVCTLVLWKRSPLRFRVAFSCPHARTIASLAVPFLISRTMGWTATQVPRLILSLSLSAADLGLFGLAARLNDILAQVLVVPKYAVARMQLRQYAEEPAAASKAAGELVQSMSIVCFPVALGGAALLPALVHAWLDSRWYGAILPAQLLLLAAVSQVTVYAAGALFLSLNQQASDAFLSTLQTTSIVLVVLVFARYGLVAAVAAMAVRPFLLIPLILSRLATRCHIPGRVMLAGQVPALIAAMTAAALVLPVRGWMEAACGSLPALVILGLAGLGIYVTILALHRPELARRLLVPWRSET